jgi:hypothetical protein
MNTSADYGYLFQSPDANGVVLEFTNNVVTNIKSNNSAHGCVGRYWCLLYLKFT